MFCQVFLEFLRELDVRPLLPNRQPVKYLSCTSVNLYTTLSLDRKEKLSRDYEQPRLISVNIFIIKFVI